MRLVNKTILLISPEPWSHIHVSKHHYAIHLARRGNKVFFLNPPSTDYSLEKTEYDDLYVLDYRGFIKGLRFLPGFIRRKITLSKYSALQKLAKVRFEVIWTFDNSVFFSLEALPTTTLKISHIVDYSMNFQFKRASRSSDYCFSTSSHILKRQLRENPRSHFINHGYDDSVVLKKFKLEYSKQLKIGYAGNLDIPYIDWDLMEQAILKFPYAKFFFAGSLKTSFKLSKYSNVICIGKLTKSELNWFLKQMDILIIAYKADQFQKQLANPHKLLEYLATGKPIVSTFTSEYSGLPGVIYMSKANSEWVDLLKTVVEDYHNEDAQLKAARIKIASENTYSKQLDRIESILKNE